MGAKNVSNQVYDEVRGILLTFIKNLMTATTAFTDSRNAATISIEDVQDAVYTVYDQLNITHVFPQGLEARLASCHLVFVKARSTEAIDVMNRHKTGDTVYRQPKEKDRRKDVNIARAAFNRLAREVALEMKYNSRFEKTALDLIQHLTESYLLDYMEDAHRASIHANRTTLWVEDIQLVHMFRGDRL